MLTKQTRLIKVGDNVVVSGESVEVVGIHQNDDLFNEESYDLTILKQNGRKDIISSYGWKTFKTID